MPNVYEMAWGHLPQDKFPLDICPKGMSPGQAPPPPTKNALYGMGGWGLAPCMEGDVPEVNVHILDHFTVQYSNEIESLE